MPDNLWPMVVDGIDDDVVVGLHGEPTLHADDPLFARGDGVFETVLLRASGPVLLDGHLDRLGDSAAIVGLPPPDASEWRAAIASATSRWRGDGEAVLRLVYGRARSGASVAFVMVSPLPERVTAARTAGVSVLTLDRGVGSEPPPWSLAGAKSSSYAVNASALRHAARHGADDVIYTSSDGVVLEGPRSNVVVCTDGVLRTPPATLPILPGITVRALFAAARARGLRCAEELLGPTDLFAAQGVWLLSSITLAARVHTLDGVPLRSPTAEIDVPALLEAAFGV